MNLKFEPPKSQSGDKKTPVTLYTKKDGGFYPGESEIDESYFCMAEMYEASVKDHEVIKDIASAEYAVTLIIPDPYTDFKLTNEAHFELDVFRYRGYEFDVQNVAPYDGIDIKVVGAAYAS